MVYETGFGHIIISVAFWVIGRPTLLGLGIRVDTKSMLEVFQLFI